MTFQRASIIRPTPGHNYDYRYFTFLCRSMYGFCSFPWFWIRKASKEKTDLIATYNMGQEL